MSFLQRTWVSFSAHTQNGSIQPVTPVPEYMASRITYIHMIIYIYIFTK